MTSPTQALSTGQANAVEVECVRGEMAFARRTPNEGPQVVVTPSYDEPMVSHDVEIRDARPIVDRLSLDREGFTLVKHKTSCMSESDPEAMCDRYMDEMTPFIKEYFNASWVVPRRRGVILRTAGESANPPSDGRSIGGPAGFAHIDYSAVAGPMMAALANEEQGISTRAYSRLLVIQAWRALSPPPQDFPLAFCDGTSVFDTDLVEAVYVGRGIKHKSWLLQYSPLHKWYYFSNMTSDEFILFKGYDSNDSRNPRSAHCSFDNRRAFPDAKPRESIEAWFFVYYD